MSLKPKRNYVNNPEFYATIVKYKAAVKEADEAGLPPPKIPNYIGECLLQIATRLSYKYNFVRYTYRDDMIADGLENAIVYGLPNFNPEKTNNPFAYFTQIIHNSFINRIHKEKKQIYIRHKVLQNSVITGTIVEHGNHDDGSTPMLDIDNDYMNEFVEKYESAARRTKVKKEQKRGLELFMDDTE